LTTAAGGGSADVGSGASFSAAWRVNVSPEELTLLLGVVTLAVSATVTVGVKVAGAVTLPPIVALQVSVVVGGPFVTHAKPVGKALAATVLEVVMAVKL
jgi:hypothetical protein